MKMGLNMAAAAFLVAGLAACNQEKKPAVDQNAETVAASPDRKTSASDETEFINKAAVGNMAEVLAGNLAAEKSENARVKAYGQMLAKDHGAADEALQTLATEKNVTLPDAMDEAQKNHLNMMKEMSGSSFDGHYMAMMIEDHKKDIDAYKKAEKNIQDPKLKEMISNTLPVLQKHLDSAQAIQKSLKK
ncbi:MAG: DUF4142 domain-containing protein [Mucilaginibacter polytrichastri]|nr:DUF4142 domain-containing protein [Mucilaginibacter polytrichastri]